ncbi:MAG: prepilin-type N-terminal cleavage/methylation domain-containing protein [Burkholderiales bacterium]|nr:prepilin-type N-terminal cleavage/methylation domain-containing protein [Burkholderiales bacterium]
MVTHKLRRGFTLIELLVVLAIVATLLALSLPRYSQSVDIARERVLVENLRTTRDAIDKFYADTLRYPESLDELVERRYLRSLPMDPILDNDKAWRILPPASEKKGQVGDLKSTAQGQTLDGKPFNEL